MMNTALKAIGLGVLTLLVGAGLGVMPSLLSTPVIGPMTLFFMLTGMFAFYLTLDYYERPAKFFTIDYNIRESITIKAHTKQKAVSKLLRRYPNIKIEKVKEVKL